MYHRFQSPGVPAGPFILLIVGAFTLSIAKLALPTYESCLNSDPRLFLGIANYDSCSLMQAVALSFEYHRLELASNLARIRPVLHSILRLSKPVVPPFFSQASVRMTALNEAILDQSPSGPSPLVSVARLEPHPLLLFSNGRLH